MAEIVTLGNLDDDDEYAAFLEGLKNDAIRTVFIVEKKDGSVYIGTNSTDRRDIVYDVYRLEQLCRQLINEAE